MSVHDYSKTPASNTAIDGVNIAEGWAPSNVNNAFRAALADIKQYIDDVGGGLSTAGSANAYTVTTNATWTAYADNMKLAVQASFTNTGAATVNVDGLGAKTIKKYSADGVADVASGDMQSGASYVLTYDGTGGYFVIIGGSRSAAMAAIDGLAKTDGNIIVGDGTTWVAESGATARASLGLTIGTHVQAYDATLTSLAALGTAADKITYTTGVDTWAEWPITAAARSILDDASVSAMRTTLGIAIGTDVQAYSANLTTYASNALTSAELGQLQNIDTTTVSATQWGYLGAMDQGGATTDGPTFTDLTLSDGSDTATLLIGDGALTDADTLARDVVVSKSTQTSVGLSVLAATSGGISRLIVGTIGTPIGGRLQWVQSVPAAYLTSNAALVILTNGSTTAASFDTSQNATFSGYIKPKSYTVGTLPSASTSGAGAIVYCSNETGGATIVFSNGTNWKRVSDLATAA